MIVRWFRKQPWLQRGDEAGLPHFWWILGWAVLVLLLVAGETIELRGEFNLLLGALEAGEANRGIIDEFSEERRKQSLVKIGVIGTTSAFFLWYLWRKHRTLNTQRITLEIIHQSELLNRPYNLREIIETIGKGALALSRADHLAIFSRDANGEVECSWVYRLPELMINTLLDHADAINHGKNSTGFRIINVPDLLDVDEIERCQPAKLGNFRGVYARPLTYENRAIAYVCCFFDAPIRWKASDLELLEAYFRQAAASLENARLFEAEQRQRRLAEALQDVTIALTSTLKLDEVFDRVLSNLSKVIPHEAADIILNENGMLRVARVSGAAVEIKQSMLEWSHPASELRNIRQMMETREAVIIPSTDEDPSWVRFPEMEWVRSMASAPIVQRKTVIGFINVYSRQPGFFQAESGPLLQAFAYQTAIAIQNANLYQQTRRRMNESQALYRALQPLLNSAEDNQELAQQITEVVIKEFDSVHCSILLFDEFRRNLKIIAQSGMLRLSESPLPIDGPGLTVYAARTGQIIYSPDVTAEPRYVTGSLETRSELAVPLTTGDTVIGVLNLESHQVDAFDSRTRKLIASFAARAALGLENARLFATIRQHSREIQLLNEINRTALQISNPSQMLHQLAAQVAGLLQADGCYITLWDESNQMTFPFAAFGPKQDIYPFMRPAHGEGTLTYAVLHHEHALIVEDIRQSPYVHPKLAAKFPVQSVLILPLIEGEFKMGAVMVGFILPHVFSPAEVALCEQAAGQIALAMAKNRLLEIAQRRAEEAENLRQATASLGTTLDTRQLLTNTLDHIERVVWHDSACVFLLEEGNFLRAWAVKNIERPDEVLHQRFELTNGLFLEIQQRMAPLVLVDAQSDPRFMDWGGNHKTHSWMGIPLIAGNEFLGVVTLDRLAISPFQPEEMEVAQAFASQAAIAVRNTQLHSAVQHMAVTDPLTKLLNRRGFFSQAREQVKYCQEIGRPISAIMMDIDFFKLVNDQYGHDAGDAVLEATADRMKTSIREYDLACRYGGEEFAILLSENNAEEALDVAQRLHQNITSTPVTTNAGPVFVTVSIGVATSEGLNDSLDSLLKHADQALYAAKEKGRNQVYSWNG